MNIKTEKIIAAHITDAWKKRKNPMYPKDAPAYPNSVIDYVYVRIDGQRRLFRLVIREASDRAV